VTTGAIRITIFLRSEHSKQ